MNRIFVLIGCLLILSCSKSGSRSHQIHNLETVYVDKKEIKSNISDVKDVVKKEELKPIRNEIVLPFETEWGVKIVNIKVNNIPLDFIFDTGASLISISETEARFLVKQGTLTEEDFLGVQEFIDANGDISEGVLVNLREIDIQGYKLYNVKASIVQNANAPLLLGQSLLEKFAQVTIDNRNEKILLK